MGEPYDYVVVGSGFGGAVAALRLAEKGYRVLVLESGRRFRDQDFAKSNWQLGRFFFLPRLGLRGIMRLDVFKGLMVLSGAGVGGGSLVYANTLIEPTREAFRDAAWPAGVGTGPWDEELAPHYATAKRMLGATTAPAAFPADEALRATADGLGFGGSFHPVDVGVYFGEPGVKAKDPYFGGDGPERTGCTLCGGCMIGCRHGAKNTLAKNYLHLAEKKGARIEAESEVAAVAAVDGGYELTVRRPGWTLRRPRKIRATNVILAAGVLGTLKLLLRCRDELKTLPNLSPTLGAGVRTNSESIIGVRVPGSAKDYSRGVAIASGVNPNGHTKIEAVRYPAGSDAMGLLAMPLVEGATIGARLMALARLFAAGPWLFLKKLWPFGFAKETVILLVMQTLDSQLRFKWQRRLTAEYASGERPPVLLPEGVEFARSMAAQIGGEAGGSISDVMGMSITAHVLGGCPMGADAAAGVIDGEHQVLNYPGLYVVGGAAVPANLGVNPSLTITAMAERAMSRIPAKKTSSGKRAA